MRLGYIKIGTGIMILRLVTSLAKTLLALRVG